ncbi:uncharacterized protein LOC143296084 [Babylonia areolata]|uniref:uncharacterized protein LOC143296084 n=1 Tax=Babylonia areolata TaxID=304850 RepID=UPI003FCFDC83
MVQIFFTKSSSSSSPLSSSSSSSLSPSTHVSVWFWMLCVLLMMLVTWSGEMVAARDLRNRRTVGNVVDNVTTDPTPPRRWGAEAEGTTLIGHMCAAQCNACENIAQCQRLCRSNLTRTWIMNCQEQETEVYQAYYDPGDSYLTRSSECPGTCSMLKDQDEAGYFIPLTPEVVLVRDVTNHSVTLTWSTPDAAPSHIVYVVQEKEKNDWAEAHLVMGADHFTRHNLSVCSCPTYRVAAVSRYGSYWFSEEVTSPDMSPGLPKGLHVRNIVHDPSIASFVITMAWLNPDGWDLQDLKGDNPFSWQHYIRCPPSVTFIPDIFEDKHNFTNHLNTLTFHVADFVIGCKIIYAVATHSKCSADLVSERAYLTMDFSCHSVEDLYSGPYCTPPPFNPPGNVQGVSISVFPGMHGARAHVTWRPPSDLGSAGVVGFYTVFFGFIQDTYGFMTFKDNFYQNVTLPGEVTEADIPIAEGNGSGDKFGILVMAGAPGQAIDHPIGFMNEVHATMSDGRVLLDEDIVVYQLEETREVRVYWSPPSPSLDATGVALQWGPVSKHLIDLIADTGGGGGGAGGGEDDVEGWNEVTYQTNVTDTGVSLSVSNVTVLEERRTGVPRD